MTHEFVTVVGLYSLLPLKLVPFEARFAVIEMQVDDLFEYRVVMGEYDYVVATSLEDDPKVEYSPCAGGFRAKAKRMRLHLEGVPSHCLDMVTKKWRERHSDLLISLTIEAVILINGVQALLEPVVDIRGIDEQTRRDSNGGM